MTPAAARQFAGLALAAIVPLLSQAGKPASTALPAHPEWGQWRGPLHTGMAVGDAPLTWDNATNVGWRVEIPGRGHSSPVVSGNRIFLTTAVPTGQAAETAPPVEGGGRGGPGGGAGAGAEHRFDVLALDRATGREIWKTPRQDGTTWSQPFVAEHGGKKQIIVSATTRVRAYDFETGRQVWEAAGIGVNPIPVPVQQNDLVYVMSGYRNPNLMAIRLGREGDLTGTDAIAWSATRGLSYTASPVLHDNRLYVVTDNAQLTCFNATTGAALYQQTRLPKPYNLKASPVGANGKLYISTEEGDVVVVKMGDTFEVVATNTLADQSFIATPAIAGGDIFLRSRTHLFRIAHGPSRRQSGFGRAGGPSPRRSSFGRAGVR